MPIKRQDIIVTDSSNARTMYDLRTDNLLNLTVDILPEPGATYLNADKGQFYCYDAIVVTTTAIYRRGKRKPKQ